MNKHDIFATVAAVAAMKSIEKLSQKECCERFAVCAVTSDRAYIEMGKLHYAISRKLKKSQTIYGELRKLGVKDSTISNAAYASKVWRELVETGFISEAQFDKLSFRSCYNMSRVQTPKSEKRLSADEIVVLVRTADDLTTELESYFSHGKAAKEVEADRREEERKQKNIQKQADAAGVIAAAELEKLKKENAKLQKQVTSSGSTETPEIADANTPADAPSGIPENVVPMPTPSPVPDATRALNSVTAMIEGLDAIVANSVSLPVKDQQTIFARLNLLAEKVETVRDTIADRIPKKSAKKAA